MLDKLPCLSAPVARDGRGHLNPLVLLAECVGCRLSIQSEGKSSLGFDPNSMAEWAANVD